MKFLVSIFSGGVVVLCIFIAAINPLFAAVDPGNLWLGYSQETAMLPPEDDPALAESLGYIFDSGDVWFNETWVIVESSFDLWMYNHNGVNGVDVQVLVAIPEDGPGTFSMNIDGVPVSYSDFQEITNGHWKPAGWPAPGGFHPYGVFTNGTRVYQYAVPCPNGSPVLPLPPYGVPNNPDVFDLIAGDKDNPVYGENIYSIPVTLQNFTKVNFYAFGLVDPDSPNHQFISVPPSHDLTVTPEPSTLILLGIGVLGFLPFLKRKKT